MEQYEVILETTAISDLRGILGYITDVLLEPQITRRMVEVIEEGIMSPDELPHRQALLRDEPYRSRGVRWLPIENYTAFYVIDEDTRTVHVLRILYSRRNWKTLL